MESLFLLLSFLTIFPPSLSQPTNQKFNNCTASRFTCGQSDFVVKYPFLLEDRPEYCGYPGFLLRCIPNEDNRIPVITVDGKDYQVKNIDYNKSVVTLIDFGLAQQPCSTSYQNTILNTSFFRYPDDAKNLTLYINCTINLPDIADFYKFTCSIHNYVSGFYYGLDPTRVTQSFIGSCSSTAVFTVRQTVLTGLRSGGGGNLTAALQEGFNINWVPGSDWCNRCTEAGGICGYSSCNSTLRTCFYPYSTVDGSCSDNNKTKPVLLGVLLYTLGGILAGGLFMAVVCFIIRTSRGRAFWRMKSNKHGFIESFLNRYDSSIPKRYTYSDVKKMTKSFREQLGQGGFGSVFQGKLLDGRQVAVKILKDSKGNGEDFINEVASIGKTSHVNVVALVGFCSEGSKRALVYDFMSNGSLDKYIASRTPDKATLSCEKLYEIAVGIARGLEYLHRGCNTRIVHFDIKPHNILLDQDFCPKISDFGLAKLCTNNGNTISMSGARGTIGYIAPEVFSRTFGVVSSKSDVYSFGMMILEMFVGKKNLVASTEEESENYFPQSIYNLLEQEIGDEYIISHAVTKESIRTVLIVGLWCIQPISQSRPSMSRVLEMLEGSVNDLSMPPKMSIIFPTTSLDVVTSLSS